MSGRDIILAGAVVGIIAIYVNIARERRIRRELDAMQVDVAKRHDREIRSLLDWSNAMNNWAFGTRHQSRPSEARDAA